MYKYVLSSVVKISMMFAKYFEYYTIILWGGRFLWTRCSVWWWCGWWWWWVCCTLLATSKRKGKGFSYSIPSVGPGADPGVQTVGRLPLLSARHALTFPAAERHHPLAGTKLYCLVTAAHRCEQLAQGCYAALPRVGLNPQPTDRKSNRLPVAPLRPLANEIKVRRNDCVAGTG